RFHLKSKSASTSTSDKSCDQSICCAASCRWIEKNYYYIECDSNKSSTTQFTFSPELTSLDDQTVRFSTQTEPVRATSQEIIITSA
ncbi:hypothetical protein M9Y10_038465, partial [Tritrichomonas musculus]